MTVLYVFDLNHALECERECGCGCAYVVFVREYAGAWAMGGLEVFSQGRLDV